MGCKQRDSSFKKELCAGIFDYNWSCIWNWLFGCFYFPFFSPHTNCVSTTVNDQKRNLTHHYPNYVLKIILKNPHYENVRQYHC
jgi:hypothetical protein